MKSLFKKIFILAILTLGPFILVQYFILTKHDLDYWMLTRKSNFLIIGQSRTKAAVAPHVLQKELNWPIEPQNIARNYVSTPFGNPYYSFIQQKVNSSVGKGIFIVSISPSSVMNEKTEWVSGRESRYIAYRNVTKNVPFNLEYMLRRAPDENLFNAIKEKMKLAKHTTVRAYENGWMERTLIKPAKKQTRFKSSDVFNHERWDYLEKTLDFLKTQGQVFVVRLPLSDEWLSIEQKPLSRF